MRLFRKTKRLGRLVYLDFFLSTGLGFRMFLPAKDLNCFWSAQIENFRDFRMTR